MRVDADGRLIYANPASAPVLLVLGAGVGEVVPADKLGRLEEVAQGGGFVELVSDGRTWAVWPVHIRDLGFTNLYGRDVTAERAIVKFPDKNPNPVLRLRSDGTLVYDSSSKASSTAWTSLSGQPCPRASAMHSCSGPGPTAQLHSRSRPPAESSRSSRSRSRGSTSSNCARNRRHRGGLERERLARENERLLLNILPEPIACWLREGEPLIADRFDDVTLMFADIVEFTRLSSSMSPSELVGVLNAVFRAFDDLVELHRAWRRRRRLGTPTWRPAACPSTRAIARCGWPDPSSWRRPWTPSRRRSAWGSGSGSGSTAVRGRRRHRHPKVHLRRLG